MLVGERGTSGFGRIVPPDLDGLPWVRLVTGLVALAIVAMPAGRHAPEWTARPVADRAITVAALAPMAPLPRPLLQAREPADDPLPATGPSWQPERSAGTRSVSSRVAQRTNRMRHRARLVATRDRTGGAAMHAGRTGRALTRAQVVHEYLAAREQVAAFTREDSGSAYLMRVAARRQPARAFR